MGIYEIMDKWLVDGRVADVYAVLRYTYRVGSPLVDDQVYESVNSYVVAQGIAEDYVNRSYDDDPIPYELLREIGLEEIIPETPDYDGTLYSYLNEEKSLSIRAVVNHEEAYEYFMPKRQLRLVMGVKVDGVFTKKLLQNKEFRLGLSRGRSGNSFDWTKNLRKILGRYFEGVSEGEVKIYSETFVEQEALEYLKAKYDNHKATSERRFKTPKSSAITMLCGDFDPEDYTSVKCLTFAAEGLDTTLSGTLKKVKELGFTPVPYIVIEPGECPADFEEFKKWLDNLLDNMWELKGNIPSDGIVVDVDDFEYVADVKNQYSSKNIALKMGAWDFNRYVGEVESIIIDQRRVECNCKVTIKPIYANDGTKATTINTFNMGMLIRNGIVIGSKIHFERNSGAVNIFLPDGNKLEQGEDKHGG